MGVSVPSLLIESTESVFRFCTKRHHRYNQEYTIKRQGWIKYTFHENQDNFLWDLKLTVKHQDHSGCCMCYNILCIAHVCYINHFAVKGYSTTGNVVNAVFFFKGPTEKFVQKYSTARFIACKPYSQLSSVALKGKLSVQHCKAGNYA